MILTSVADPNPYDTDLDPDPAFHFDTDPDPDPAFRFGQIQIRTRLFNEKPDPTVLCRSGPDCFIRIRIRILTVLKR
jgi:hypothetical protein